MIHFKYFKLGDLTSPKFLCILFIVVMCIQIVGIEGYGVSPVKVVLMGTAPLFFIMHNPRINKALVFGGLFIISCILCAYMAGPVRWSTIIYQGMFIFMFVCFYSLLRQGQLQLDSFKRFLKYFIYTYCIVLILQQICILVGIRNLVFINLYNQYYLAIDKLPLLTQEPSSSARILAVLMLGYLRCTEIEKGYKPTVSELFSAENRWVTILFLYAMTTMGSGTAFICLGILLCYFINRKSVFYIIPFIVCMVIISNYLEINQLTRVKAIAEATSTGNIENISETDQSASTRIIPLLNFLTKTDLSNESSWYGNGTLTLEDRNNWYKSISSSTISMVDQYGILTFLFSLILVYTCIIRRFLSIETIFFIIIFGMSLGNFAYTWGAMMIFAAVRYFQEQQEAGTLEYAEEELDEDMDARLIEEKESAN